MRNHETIKQDLNSARDHLKQAIRMLASATDQACRDERVMAIVAEQMIDGQKTLYEQSNVINTWIEVIEHQQEPHDAE